MPIHHLKFLAVVTLTSLIAFGAHAGTILQPVGASTDMGSYPGYSPTNTINQSGLAAGYTSGVTDFDTYVTTTSTLGGGNAGNIWFSAQDDMTGNFDFDLGGTFTIESFALWTDPQTTADQGVRDFRLQLDDNAAFSSPTEFGTFTAADVTGAGNAEPNNFGQVFSFAPTEASFVRLVVLSNYNPSFHVTGISEVAFEVVPEPTTFLLVLAGLGLAGTLVRRRSTSR